MCDTASQEWVNGVMGCPTGLVPEFAAYPSSTTVESEWVGVMVVEMEDETCLSDDKGMVEDGVDMGSKSTDSKGGVGVVDDAGGITRHLLGVVLRVSAVKLSHLWMRPVRGWWWVLLSHVGDIC